MLQQIKKRNSTKRREVLQLCYIIIYDNICYRKYIQGYTSVYSWGEGNIITSSYMSISSPIINLDMNSEEYCFFCIVLQA